MVRVTFRNPVTEQTLPVDELDESMTVREAVDHLIEHSFIPPARDGRHYLLAVKGKMELTRDDATLSSANVADGDVINVLVAQRGGR